MCEGVDVPVVARVVVDSEQVHFNEQRLLDKTHVLSIE